MDIIRTRIVEETRYEETPLRARLSLASAAARSLPTAPTFADLAEIKRLYELLYDIHREVPKVMAWCAVKFYRDNLSGDPGHTWRPAVWTAHANEETAALFAEVIQVHYIKKHRVDNGDRFRAVYCEARILDFVPADTTPEQFCAIRCS